MALTRALFVRQIQRLHTAWLVWSTDSRYRASVTPQVISLEHMAERNLDCRIRIDELDGKPYDFLINVEGNPDMAKLTRLLNTYKLAGKSYIYELAGPVDYSCFFFNHVEEDIQEKYTCEFTDHMPEDDREVIIRLFLMNKYVADTQQWMVVARASKKVKSNVNVFGSVMKKEGYVSLISDFHLILSTDTSNAERQVQITNAEGILFLEVSSISPEQDDYYDYKVDNLTQEMNYGTYRF